MLLADLLPLLAADERIADLSNQLREPEARRLVGPLPVSARPALSAVLARLLGPLLLVAPSPDAAARLHTDLCAWLGEDHALLFPASDAMPYEHMSADAGIVAQRLRVLERLRRLADEERQENLVIVAPIKALLQPTLTPGELRFATRHLVQGARVAPHDLLSHWIDIGYRNAPLVEEPGELSSRGGIIDIFPPTEERPVRLEFFGDELESLRSFDPADQRSRLRMRELVVGPPHEIPLWRREEALRWGEAIEREMLRPEVQREWEGALERLALGERFEGRAFFAPLFHQPGSPATLLAHLPPHAPILFSELRDVAGVARDLLQHAEESRAAQIAAGELPPNFPRPLWLWEEYTAQLVGHALVDLSNQPVDERPEGPQDLLGLDPYVLELFTPPDHYGGKLRQLMGDLKEQLLDGERVVLVSPQAARLRELAHEHGLPLVEEEDEEQQPSAAGVLSIRHGQLQAGWRAAAARMTLLTDVEIFGWRPRRAVLQRRRTNRPELDRAAFLQSLSPGDYVVHIEHGIGVFEGLTHLAVDGVEREYLQVRYAAGDRLYVPIDQADRLSRYIGAGEEKPTLTRLGTADWERVKRRVRAAVEDLAEDLLELYATRQLAQGHAYSPDTVWQHELEESFPFIETEDQLRALEEVKADMQSLRPMDRLICGDVGYGKTEVALRAAFKAVQDGFQVAVLVPTTILAQQHFETFTQRMAPFPVTIEMLSRFRTPAEQKRILERLEAGLIDVVIGTHRLLSKDVRFKQLGLVIVDEEQRFGVRHKEALKKLRREVDVLTLTATPIPRTLHMALAGIRDLSIINTPPEDRVPIKSYVQPYDEQLVRDAILRELARGGQVYFVHNRVQSIYTVAERLRHLVPEARIGVGHGQMPEKELERVMLDFFEGRFDVLVCTTIIESGLDVPNANTIIIDNAPFYGLAQLYQLRGRVGRSAQRAYAYLLYHPAREMGEDARRRLEAIQEATELGAGFRIAMRDLEIRGAGSLLGAEQSGHIAAVGFDLYTRLLAQVVERLRARRQAEAAGTPAPGLDLRQQEALRRAAATVVPSSERPEKEGPILPEPLVTIDLPLTAYLPESYIPGEMLRLQVYQRLSGVRTLRDVREMRAELRDRFGDPPPEAERLLDLLQLKVLALQAGVSSISTFEDEITVRLPPGSAAQRARLQNRLNGAIRIGPSFARLDRRALGERWLPALQELLSALLKS
ncbi:MAG: transcription-repair-coupling factor [Herpetosiphonaceae bacterium]|nr:MAG: transcription-repair-coupling factor [Herpetosiphonaceae bacterium]